MKRFSFLVALAVSSQLTAQNNFQKIGPPPPAIQTIDELEGLNGSTHASADVDNDGDADLLIAGQNAQGAMKCNLYLNNGSGAFQLDPTTPFTGVFDGSIVFLDVEDDGDQDAIVSGQSSSNWTAVLYTNDGSGGFTVASTPFDGVGYSSISTADVDGDTDMDVLICGQASSGVKANLYLNDGSGNFTLDPIASATFTGIYLGTSEFGDVDGDGDADLVLMGYADSGTFSGMYLNDGNGVFTVTASSFPQLNGSDIAFSDIDDDTDMDMVIAGNDPNTGGTTKLYFNDGTGAFTLDNTSSFSDFGSAWLDFNDVDSDGDEDLVICGSVPGLGNNTILYSNDGSGLFTPVTGTPFTGVYNGCVSFEDIDGDADDDLVVTGSSTAKLYQNDGNGVFAAISTSPFTGLSYGAVELADVDNDGDLDAFMNGQGASGFHSLIYLNDGNGGFTVDPANIFPGLANAAADFADIDNDGDDDLMMSGYGTGQVVKLFTNDGTGLFTEVANTPFPPVSSGAIQFNDVDSDGDQDVFINGFTIFVGNVGQLWLNDGSGSFTLSASNTFEGSNNGNIAFADIDGDNDDDLLLTGYGDLGRIAHLYTNDGSGTFTLIPSPFPGIQQGSIAFADIDNDQDMDLAIAGEIGSPSTYAAQLYTNDGTGTFTLVAGTPFEPTITSGLLFADIDNDLDSDLLTIGHSSLGGSIAKMFANDGSGIFTEITGTPFIGASYGMAAFGDIDGDIDPDVIICGNDEVTGLQSNVYRNNNCQQSNVIDVQYACGPYTWIDGNIYTQSTSTATMVYPMPNSEGCDSVAILHLTIGDAIAVPTVANLANVLSECEVVSLTAPTATMNCTGLTTGTTTQVFPITLQDTTEVVWTYTSPNGFVTTQTQLVIIQDITAPTPSASLPTITDNCPIISVSVIPTALDNCSGVITGTTSDLPITTPGTTNITWTFTDASGNSSTQTQTVIYTPLSDQITFDGTTFMATQANATYEWFDCDSENTIPGATSQTYVPTANGNYGVTISNGSCSVSSSCFLLTNLAVNELEANAFSVYPNPTAGTIYIETVNPLSVVITNAAGQLIHTEALQSGKTMLELDGIESGVYFATFTDSNGKQSAQKIILTR
ncbi:FG-GAP-like repeat-containing protein [Fluviicola taffensis]|uniref:FG-GAP-like repeat-containing protein n=1 Tax=Fluviicola taffensis TaxID=191579 RepID=UPI003137EF15